MLRPYKKSSLEQNAIELNCFSVQYTDKERERVNRILDNRYLWVSVLIIGKVTYYNGARIPNRTTLPELLLLPLLCTIAILNS